MMIGTVSVIITDSRQVCAKFVLFVAFRGIDFEALANFLMMQTLDNKLHQSLNSFFAVFQACPNI